MQFINDVRQKAGEFAQENAAALLTAGGVVGVVATGILSGRAGFKLGKLDSETRSKMFQEQYEQEDERVLRHETDEWINLDVSKKELILGSAAELLPPVLTGTAAIAAIIMSNRMSAQKAAALAAAYGIAERNLSEYKEKVAEKLTGPKQKDIQTELAQERVNVTPGSDKIVFVEGEVLCFDKATGRYFNSTMESIKQAINTTNAEIFNHGHATANFFYDELGLPGTTWAGEVGFNAENMLEVEFDTVLAPGNRPCISIDFKTMPRTDFDNTRYDRP